MRKRIFDLKGESFENSDGSSRQEALRHMQPGDMIKLVRELDNPHGAAATLVVNADGIGLGYISSADSKELAPVIDSGRQFRAQVHELRGGMKDYPSIGCRICLAFDKEKMRQAKPLDENQIYFASEGQSGGCLGALAGGAMLPLTFFAAQYLGWIA